MSELKVYTNKEMLEGRYHGEEFADYLSGSELWEYYSKCPAEAVYGEKKDTDALKFGSMMHMAMLEFDLFNETHARDFEAPEDCLNSDSAMKSWLKAHGITGYSTKKQFDLVAMVHMADPEQKCFIDEQAKYQAQHEGKEFIKHDLYDQIITMRETMMNYPTYRDLILGSRCEHSVIGYSEKLGCNVKVKPDIWPNGIINYKTVSNAEPNKLLRDCFEFGYLLKEFFNGMIIEELTGEFPQIAILAQSKKPPYVVTGIELDEEQIAIGREQFNQAFALWKECKEQDAYIDYTQGGFISVPTPDWMIRKTVG